MADVDIIDYRIERIVRHELLRKRADGFAFIEGPVWKADEGVLIFSDIPRSRMYRFDPKTERVDLYRFPSNMGNGNTYDHEHRLVTCEHATSRVVREEVDGTLTVIASEFDGAELNSPNDIVIDESGRLYFTDPPYGRQDAAGLPRPETQPAYGVYRVDPTDSSVVRLADDFLRPNGLCFAEDERVLYVNDSARMHIRRFEVSGDRLTGGEVWAQVHGQGPGAPDGMKIDSEGNLYCCGPGGIHIFADDGCPLGVLKIPEEVANFNWGDEDLQTLYLTASTGLYSCRMKVPGASSW